MWQDIVLVMTADPRQKPEKCSTRHGPAHPPRVKGHREGSEPGPTWDAPAGGIDQPPTQRPALAILLGIATVVLGGPLLCDGASPLLNKVDFNRDVRPILSDNCFPCHGQDAHERKAKLRLDTERGSRMDLGGHAAVVPGDVEKSELVRRIFATETDDRMPPPDSHHVLTGHQQDLLKRWVAEGGKYDRPWAFQTPVKAQPPRLRETAWVRSPVDAFVLGRLEAEGLRPSREAAPGTWLRRASFDLTGLAPTTREIDAFIADREARGEAAYEDAVDRLLASPRFGERQTQEWLDIARYADTHGFNNDSARTMWRWRDWVIDAFNDGMPYDRFIVEQLAGDLLPHATLDDRIATGFERNHVVNSEGGIIGEEYRVEYVADRVRTLGMAWLGLTLECCRCHDHKFDPLTQRDYYRFFAFFNNIDEFGEDGRIGNAAPILIAPTREQQRRLARLDEEIASEDGRLTEAGPASPSRVASGLRTLVRAPEPDPPESALFTLGTAPTSKPVGRPDPVFGAVLDLDGGAEVVLDVKPSAFSPAQPWTVATWVRWTGGEAPIVSTMDMLLDPSAVGSGEGAELRVTGDGRIEVRLAAFWPAYAIKVLSQDRLSADRWRHVAVSYDGSARATGVRILLDGRPAEVEICRDGLSSRSASSHAPRVGSTVAKAPEWFHGALAGLRLYTNVVDERVLAPWVEHEGSRWALADPATMAAPPRAIRELALRQLHGAFAAHWARRERLRLERQEVLRSAPQTMVMEDRPSPRQTHILVRGRYDAPGDPVEPGVPEALLGEWPEGAPKNRLGLALWLTRPDHPLTARVVVNRIWAQLFGTGLVKTVEDFGAQGEPPSHPDLLDWLAVDFVDTGWDVKRLFRELVLSATYRQDSAIAPSLASRDPENRLFARGPRVRLPAESIRDHALAISGLLVQRLGGPSVFPPQPPTLYDGVVVAADYPGTKWVTSLGAGKYRRSLYTFWKRTVPHPVMTTFDVPDRESCTARRLLTNTPQQALALMNEPAFVEAGHALGLRGFHDAGKDAGDRVSFVFRLGTGRRPGARELAALSRTLAMLEKDYAADPDAAKALLGRAASAEEAAWAALGSLVLNLDETITKD